MKRFFAFALGLAAVSAMAQNPNAGNSVTPWRMGGNAANASDFLGTTNSQPLILKSNNTTGMEIKPTGDLYFPTLGSSTGTLGLVVVGGDGHGGRIDILHNFTHVLNGQGIFTDISQLTGMKLSGNNILQTATGNIGIGTLTPTSKLSVVGDGSFTGELYTGGITISNFAGTGDRELYVDANGTLKISNPPPGPVLLCSNSLNWNLGGNNIGPYMSYTPPPAVGTCDNFDFVLKANSTNHIWLKTDGKVGIGTNDPTAQLAVLITGNNKAFNISNSGTDLFSVNADGGTNIHLTNPSPAASVLTMTHANGSTFKVLANGTGDITSSSAFSAHFGNGANDNFAIYQGIPGSGIQHFYMAGGTGSSYFRTTDANASGTAFMIVNNPTTTGTGVNKTVFLVSNNGNTTIEGDITSSALAQANSPSRTLMVDPNGKILAGPALGSIGSAWLLGGNNSSSNASFGTSDGSDLPLVTGSGTEKMRITASGNVGLNNPIPYRLLTVNGDVCFAHYSSTGVNAGSNGLNGIEILGGNGVPTRRGISVNDDPNGDFNFYINSNQSGSGFNFKNGNGNNTLMQIASTGELTLNSYSSSNAFKINNSQGNTIFKISSSGAIQSGSPINLGPRIPTNPNFTTSDVLLTVDGKVVVSKDIWVADDGTAGWADYVFASDYKLKSLDEVEGFIKINKHLPNVPSAEEIRANGQNLGKLQVTQMEKIEELYLYLLEINKRVEELKKENEFLKAELQQHK